MACQSQRPTIEVVDTNTVEAQADPLTEEPACVSEMRQTQSPASNVTHDSLDPAHGGRRFLRQDTFGSEIALTAVTTGSLLPQHASSPAIMEATNTGLPFQAHGLSRRQGYTAVDPFSPSIAQTLPNNAYNAHAVNPDPPRRPSSLDPLPPSLPTSVYVSVFLCDVLPRQIYLHLLLRLPSLYFSRVARVFEEAELSMPDIREMAIVTSNRTANCFRDPLTSSIIVPPSYTRLTAEWEYFINTLVKEWKTLNIVSVLLLTAILATLQIDNAYNNPISRHAALHSLVCAMMSLLYGCVYIIRFNNMRKAHKAAEWAEEAQKTRTSIWWNVWVLLAMPAVWLSWSMVFYLICLFVFIWRVPDDGSSEERHRLSLTATLGLRITLTVVFGLGALYFGLIMATFRRYGAVMDRNWQKKMMEWVKMSESRESAVADDVASSHRSMSVA